MKTILYLVFLSMILAACTPATSSLPSTPTAIPQGSSNPPTPMEPREVKLLPEEPVPFSTSEWRTNFKKHSVPFRDILSGGPPKDGIPAIDHPKFISPGEAKAWLKDNEPVILFEHQNDARAYPLQILMWHEIVNDTVGGQPVVVTFCPLCNSSIVFDRVVAGEPTTFGTTGKLHYSDLVMYDRTTESWWQQLTGEGIVGDRTGYQLTFLHSQVIAFSDFKARYPEGQVLSRATGFARNYGVNPYVGYDAIGSSPFLYVGPPTPGTLLPTERVVTLDLGGTAIAYPYRVLSEERVVNDTIAGRAIVVLWKAGTASALDNYSLADGRDIGSTGVFDRKLDNRPLTFVAEGNQIKDTETGTVWDILGRGVEGTLKGTQLTPIVHGNYFWFAWAAFRPNSKIHGVQ